MRKYWVLLAAAALAVMLWGCTSEKPAETTAPETEPVIYDSYYDFYHYGTQAYCSSDLATYQAVTGARCELSSLSWEFLNGDYTHVVEGYDQRYGIFVYAYDSGLLERYSNYLISAGYECLATEQYAEGISYYYRNEDKYIVELFVVWENAYLVIEPYIQAE